MESRGAIRWVWAAAFAAMATVAGPVGAFYWYGPPEKSLIGPPMKGKVVTKQNGGDPPPGGKEDPPPEVPPGGGDPPPVATPEPTTLFGALAGLGTLAAGRALRQRKAR